MAYTLDMAYMFVVVYSTYDLQTCDSFNGWVVLDDKSKILISTPTMFYGNHK